MFQVTECEIFLSLLVKFLESDKLGWQRAIALEVLYRIVILPELLMYAPHVKFLSRNIFI